MKKITIALSLITATFLFIGCDSSSTETTQDSSLVKGTLVDPYISGAVLCQDSNDNGICEASEPTSTATTAEGSFSFDENLTAGKKVIIKSQGLHEGKKYDLDMSGVVAEDGTIDVVSPLTTLNTKDLTSQDILDILMKAKTDALTYDGAQKLQDFTIANASDLLQDPLSNDLMDKKASEITDKDLSLLQASLTSYALLKIMNGSERLSLLSGADFKYSATTTGEPVNLIVRSVLNIVTTNLNIEVLQNVSDIFLNPDTGVRAALIAGGLPEATANKAIVEPTAGLVVEIAVKVVDSIAQIGYDTCNATDASDDQKVTAALNAVAAQAPKILANINSMGATMYAFDNKDIINSTLSGVYSAALTGLKAGSADMKMGLEADADVTTFVFDEDGKVVPYKAN